MTDYRLEQIQVLFPPSSASTARPGGRPEPLTLTQLGGSVVVEGYPVQMIHTSLPLLKVGTEGIFLLVRIDGKYRVVGNYYGAFAIERGSVLPLNPQGIGDEHRGESVEQFVAVISHALRQLGR